MFAVNSTVGMAPPVRPRTRRPARSRQASRKNFLRKLELRRGYCLMSEEREKDKPKVEPATSVFSSDEAKQKAAPHHGKK